MSTFEVKIYKLTIEEHPNADAIELARVGDYRSIVRKGQFQTGDLAAYIPEGSIVPDIWIERLGLVGKLAGSKRNRVKAVRLRGAVSQGLIVPIEFRKKIMDQDTNEFTDEYILASLGDLGAGHVVHEGDDVTELMGVTKWEPPIPTQMAGEVFNAFGKTIHYDIENIKKHPDILEEGEIVSITEKIHGCADYDTIIETLEFGNMKIGDIVKNKVKCHVKSYNISSNEIQFNEILGYSEQETVNNWFSLETIDGETIKLTGNHLVWLPELNCYRAVEELKGDEILLISE